MKGKGKIVIIVNNFPPVICGVGDYSFHLASEFYRLGYEVHVICAINKEKPVISTAFDVWPVIEKWNIKGFLTLVKTLKELKTSRVIIQYVPYSFQRLGMPFLLMPFILYVRLFLGISITTTFHELANGKGLKHIKYFIPAVSQYFIGYFQGLISNRIVCNNKPVQKELGLFKYKIALIPVGPNFNLSRKVDYRFRTGPVRIVTFGFSLSRNYLIYEVAQRFAGKVEWYVLGKFDNDLQSKIAKRYNDEYQIYFTGTIEDDEIDKYMKSADIFLLQEDVDKNGIGGIGTKSGIIVAAFAAALPIVGTKGHLTDENFFINKQNCFLADNNIESICEGINLLLRDDLLRESIGNEAFVTYQKHFSWSSIADKYTQVLQ